MDRNLDEGGDECNSLPSLTFRSESLGSDDDSSWDPADWSEWSDSEWEEEDSVERELDVACFEQTDSPRQGEALPSWMDSHIAGPPTIASMEQAEEDIHKAHKMAEFFGGAVQKGEDVKADDAQIPVWLWNQRYYDGYLWGGVCGKSGLHWGGCEPETSDWPGTTVPKWIKALEVLRPHAHAQ